MATSQNASAADRLSSIKRHLAPVSQEPHESTYTQKSRQSKQSKYYPTHKVYEPHRPVKTIIIGTGIAGVATAILLSKKVRNHTIKVYEKNERVGGTWAVNNYPGTRCDVPSHAYQLTFAPNYHWSEYYPKAAEIQQYYENIISEYKVRDKISFNHEVIKATWLGESSKWEVIIKDLKTGEAVVDQADFLVTAPGRLNKTHTPPIPGLATFKGKLIHTAEWDHSYEHRGKRVAIIGNGASGQQILPNIVHDVSHLDHYVRSKVWISPTFRASLHEATAAAPGGPTYSKEQRKQWADDPTSYVKYRKNLESGFHGLLAGTYKNSPQNNLLRETIVKTMLTRLNGDEEWLARVLPDYAPGCKRITPAPGYLESLLLPHVEYVTEPIVSATETGLKTADGTLREVDAIITATGFSDGYAPRFPTIGKSGVDLVDKWSFDGDIGYPETYLGMMAPGFPNYFFVMQAQGNGMGGTVPLQAELSATFIAKAIRKVQTQSYASIAPSAEATDDFNSIVSGFFEDKVTTDKCNSWFKPIKQHIINSPKNEIDVSKYSATEQRVVIGWPGTGHHRFDILRDIRWEDFEFERTRDAQENRFEYFGNGDTAREARYLDAKNGGTPNVKWDGGGWQGGEGGENENHDEVTAYLKEKGKVDLETLHEQWNE